MRRVLITVSAFIIAGFAGRAIANWGLTQGGATSGTSSIVFAVDAANQGTSLCAAANVECPATILVNTAGAPVGIQTQPIRTDPVGTTIQPVNPGTIGNWGLSTSAQNTATPTNDVLVGGQYNAVPTTITSGNQSPLQLDSGGNLRVVGTGIAIGSTTSGQTGSLVFGSTVTALPAYPAGQSNPMALGTGGQQIILPYSNKENMVRGAANAATTIATSIIAAQGAGNRTYVTAIQCYRSDAGTSSITVTFNDSAPTVMVLPNSGGGGGSNAAFPVPLQTAANTAFTFAAGTATANVYCNAQGYFGT